MQTHSPAASYCCKRDLEHLCRLSIYSFNKSGTESIYTSKCLNLVEQNTARFNASDSPFTARKQQHEDFLNIEEYFTATFTPKYGETESLCCITLPIYYVTLLFRSGYTNGHLLRGRG